MASNKDTAGQILDELWLGSATKPAQNLYPHQWSWDSAFIAIGNRHRRWDRARSELVALFQAQWSNGMVPHIVFGPAGSDYFPNAAFWDVQAASGLSPSPTSGICQPPVHAIAVKMVAEAAAPADALAFITEMYEPLAAWHEYLHRVRGVDGPLVEIWHPWESGMDNSPAWDGPMAAMSFDQSEVPSYRRVDTELIDAGDRPSDAEYDRYAYIVGQLRDHGYAPAEPRSLPFRMQDVLFNSALAASERVMADLAQSVGVDNSIHEERAEALEFALHDRLWDEAAKMYFSRDLVSGELVPATIAGGLLATLTPLPSSDRRDSLLQTLRTQLMVEVGDGFVVRTAAATEPGFDPIRYWRGPSWIQMNWLLAYGLDVNDQHSAAQQVRSGIVELVDQGGFHEYFDAPKLRGHGTDRFGWTAALYLDAVAQLDGFSRA